MSEEQQIVPKAISVSKEFISILAIVFGILLVALGCGFAFGLPIALIATGAVILVFGFVLGLGK